MTSSTTVVDEDEEHYEPGPFPQPNARKVVYCPNCGLPPEYCEFNTKTQFNLCKPWLIANYPQLYPQLLVPAERPLKKKPPKGIFFHWPEILAFHNVRQQNITRTEPILYRGKVKLHGSNSAINIQKTSCIEPGTPPSPFLFTQSRNNFVFDKVVNFGFRGWAEAHAEYFFEFYNRYVSSDDGAVVIFGEWCGNGIMKGASVCTLESPIFAVFAVQLQPDRLIISPGVINELFSSLITPRPAGMHILPWFKDIELPLVFSDQQQLLRQIDLLNELVEEVDREDPWVKEVLGVAGPGEGIVYYPVGGSIESIDNTGGSIDKSLFASLVFKTKGPTHSVVRQSRSVVLSAEVASSVDQFVDMFVTNARCEQGVAEGCHGEVETWRTGSFIQWIVRDVEKECQAELQASGLSWPAVRDAVEVKAKRWFSLELMKRGASATEAPPRESECAAKPRDEKKHKHRKYRRGYRRGKGGAAPKDGNGSVEIEREEGAEEDEGE